MARHIDAADTAKIIRKVLKKEFPTTKFSVRIHRYSGGSSVNVSWTDGAAWEKVNTALLPFNGKHFDGMTDMESYQYTMWEGEEVCFGQYLNVDRNTTRAFINRVYQYCLDRFSNHSESLKIVGSDDSSSFDVDDYYENEWILRKAREIVRQSDSDRVFNWEVEKQQNKECKQLEEQAISNQKAKDEKYLMSLSVPQDYAQYSNAETEDWKVDDTGLKELVKYCTTNNNIIDFPKTKNLDKPSFLDNAYKTWVQDLITGDRLTEIINYEEWRETYGQSALEQQYKTFVTQCLDQKLYQDIISFDKWLVCNF